MFSVHFDLQQLLALALAEVKDLPQFKGQDIRSESVFIATFGGDESEFVGIKVFIAPEEKEKA